MLTDAIRVFEVTGKQKTEGQKGQGKTNCRKGKLAFPATVAWSKNRVRD